MPYDWKTTTKPATPVNGQLHIDPTMKIYQYDSATNSWMIQPDYYVKTMEEFTINSESRPVGHQIKAMSLDKVNTLNWENQAVFDKSFLQIDITQGGSLVDTKYIAHYTYAQFSTWFAANIPNSGGIYEAAVQVRVNDVFDPHLGKGKIKGHNGMYGSFRGKDLYYGECTLNPDTKFTATSTFWTNYTSTMAIELLYRCFGITTVANNDFILWSARNHRTLYHFPKVGSHIIQKGTTRIVYNVLTDNYESLVPIPQRHWIVGDPIPLVYYSNDGTRTFSTMRDEFKGHRFLSQKVGGVLVFPLSCDNYRAFLFKPYGITHVVFDTFDNSKYDLWSSTSFKDMAKNRLRVVPTSNVGSHFRQCFAHDALQTPYPTLNGNQDGNHIPRYTQFFLRDKVTGLRGDFFPGVLKIVTRKPHMPMGFLIDRNVPRG